MHTCTVLYFGMIADALGKSREQLEFPDAPVMIDLLAFFAEKYPVLQGLAWKVALNQELVDGECVVPESAEIVLLPPFAGG